MPTDSTFPALLDPAGDTDENAPTVVNIGDTGAFEAIAALHRDGAPVEAVVASVEEADALAASRFGSRIARVRIDLSRVPSVWARREGVAIRASLRANGVTAPRADDAGVDHAPAAVAA